MRKQIMRFRRKIAITPEILSIFLVAFVTLYQAVYFLLYEYGTPLPAKSISEYKKEYDERNKVPYNYPIHLLPPADYKKLIDLNFNFHIINKRCKNAHPFLLILVYTAPEHFLKRKVVRETWGITSKDVLTLFILGETEDSKISSKLLEENRVHKDFLQGSFLDTYKNLTYKHVMMLKYSIYHCPQAKYLLKADDDIYVNLPEVLNFLKTLSLRGARNFLFCPPNYGKVVRSFRGYNSKWRLTFSEYPHYYHPPSCNGYFYVYSKNVAFRMYVEAQKAPYFWLEDVHITGHLFKKMNVGHVNARPFMIRQNRVREMMRSGEVTPWPFFFSGPDLDEKEIEWLDGYVRNRTGA